jgi:hypothetical protein
MKPQTGSILSYLLIASLVLIARALFENALIPVSDPSQASLLRWPVLVVILLAGLAGILLSPFALDLDQPASGSLREAVGQPLALGAAGALGLILLDVIFRFPKNLNVPFPDSLPFYFIGAFITEILLHQLPLLLIVGGLGRLLLRNSCQQSVIWGGILFVAAFEPAAQTMGELSAGYGPDFLIPFFVLIYAINLVQLLTFRRLGFFAMLAVRWGLYLVWHILWGPLRLRLIF